MTEEKPDFKYWAFISYSHRDEQFCGWLHGNLDSYKTPSSLVGDVANDGIHTVPAKLYPIFRDREELPAGANLTDVITSALKTSRYLIVICSPHSATSKWVNQEIEYFASMGREKYILPIILDGEPNSTDPQKPECFPPALRAPKEPLAADARKGKDGRDSALMKLRAGLLGVGLEDLINRELKRQKKQVMWYALLAVLMLGLAVFSWVKQQEAVHNYGLALAEKANLAFAEKRMNDGQIYAAHALARIDTKGDKDNELTRYLMLNRRAEQPGIPVVIQPAERDIDHFTISPNGKIYVSRDKEDESKILLSNAATGKRLAILRGHEKSALNASFSLDGKMLASGSMDKTIRLWDIVTGKQLSVLKGHEEAVNSVAFSPDGKMLASGSWDNTVRLWDVASGKQLAVLNGHESQVYSVSFSADGKTLASGSNDNTVRLWDVATGKQIALFNGHEDRVLSVSFSSDGKMLASGDIDKTIRLWEVATGKQLAVLKGHEKAVNSVSFSLDGKKLLSTGSDNKVRLWNVASGKLLLPQPSKNEQAKDEALSPNGMIRASAKLLGKIHLSDATTGKQLALLKDHELWVRSVSFSPDGKTLISEDSQLQRQWSLDDIFVRDWAAQATQDEKQYGLKLEGMKLVPIGLNGAKP